MTHTEFRNDMLIICSHNTAFYAKLKIADTQNGQYGEIGYYLIPQDTHNH